MGSTVVINGSKVAVGTAAAFKKMAAAFKAKFGLDLLVTDGYRTYAEQKDLWDRWKGYKKPPFYAPSVAPPGTSLHESGRALDLRDSGSDAGVTMAGNVRSNWLRANAKNYGFAANGYNFSEPWHYEYQGDPWAGSGSSSGALAVDGVAGTATVKRLQSLLGTPVDGVISSQSSVNKKFFPGFTAVNFGSDGSLAVRALQKKLGVAVDGFLGPNTIKAWQKKLGVSVDGYFGSGSVKALQRALNKGSIW